LRPARDAAAGGYATAARVYALGREWPGTLEPLYRAYREACASPLPHRLRAGCPRIALKRAGGRIGIGNRVFPYFATDLIVPTWNAAFVYDTETGAQAVLDIIEFANSRLLEFRYYDQLLGAELERIYPQLQQKGGLQSWFGRRLTRAARQVHTLFIEVNEVTDKAERVTRRKPRAITRGVSAPCACHRLVVCRVATRRVRCH